MSIENVIAIDGPAGSGKSTVAKMVAAKLNILFVDTGAMFRALALHFENRQDEISAESLAKLNFIYGKSADCLIEIDGINYQPLIRTPKASDLSSQISSNPIVRNYLLHIQQQIPSDDRPCCMEGRDIGTVVFPQARLKVFLTADVKIRARRRFEDLKKEPNFNNITLEEVEKELLVRDARDSYRELAPLKVADDAKILNTTKISLDRVVEIIIQWAYESSK